MLSLVVSACVFLVCFLKARKLGLPAFMIAIKAAGLFLLPNVAVSSFCWLIGASTTTGISFSVLALLVSVAMYKLFSDKHFRSAEEAMADSRKERV